jgi:glycosyltransferase involved in cell wall biosynthesis
MKYNLYIIISSLKDESPVKASISLVNNIDYSKFNVNVVYFKNNNTLLNTINKNVKVIRFTEYFILFKILKFKRTLNNSNFTSISISYGFFADCINFLLRKNFRFTISNIRGTLYELYSLKHGQFLGKFKLKVHNYILKNNDILFVLNSNILNYYFYNKIGKSHYIFNNFIDQDKYPRIKKYHNNSDIIKLIYLGSITKEKGAFVLIETLHKLYLNGIRFHINFIGKSKNKNFSKYINKFLPKSYFKYSGYLENPFYQIANSDYLVHPSYSEGTPRAAIESLFYETPVIIRNSVSNGLIKDDINGFIFQDDTDLYHILYNILTRNYILKGQNLIPISFTKQYNIQLLNNFLNKLVNEK